jgi:hypothetical protein
MANNSSMPSLGDSAATGPSAHGDFAAPLNGAPSGRLVFVSGAENVTLAADPTLLELYRAHFEQQVPGVRVQGGTISIQYPSHGIFNWLAYRNAPLARITLNHTIPWEIEFSGGVAKLTADLSGLQLRALDLNSVSKATLTLPRPDGIAYIHLSGSASDLTIHRPAGAAVQVNIGGGASQLRLDEQRIGAVGGGLRWQSQDFASAAGRYEISISGSVSKLMVDVQ